MPALFFKRLAGKQRFASTKHNRSKGDPKDTGASVSPRDQHTATTSKCVVTKSNGAGGLVFRKAQAPAESRNVSGAANGSIETSTHGMGGEMSSPLAGTAPLRKEHLNFASTISSSKASENTVNLMNAIATVQQQSHKAAAIHVAANEVPFSAAVREGASRNSAFQSLLSSAKGSQPKNGG